MDDLESLREEIDAIDNQILADLVMRVKLCQAIGEIKKHHNKPVHDGHRETKVFQRIRDQALLLKLDPLVIERIYREIVNMCSSVQQ